MIWRALPENAIQKARPRPTSASLPDAAAGVAEVYLAKINLYMFKLVLVGGLLLRLVLPLYLNKVLLNKITREFLWCPGRGFWVLSPNLQMSP